jgi:hypothetical protein
METPSQQSAATKISQLSQKLIRVQIGIESEKQVSKQLNTIKSLTLNFGTKRSYSDET